MRFTWNCHVVMRLASRPDRVCFRKLDPRLTEKYNYTSQWSFLLHLIYFVFICFYVFRLPVVLIQNTLVYKLQCFRQQKIFFYYFSILNSYFDLGCNIFLFLFCFIFCCVYNLFNSCHYVSEMSN